MQAVSVRISTGFVAEQVDVLARAESLAAENAEVRLPAGRRKAAIVSCTTCSPLLGPV